MKKHILAVSLLLFALRSVAQSEEKLEIYTGPSQGEYYASGQELCEILNCSNKTSNGSIENINQLNDLNGYKIAIVQSDTLHDAYYGIGVFAGYNFNNMRTISALYEEAYTIVVRANSDITCFDDLKNKTVNVGKLNSGNYHAIKKLLTLHNMKLHDFKYISHLSIDAQGKALCKETIDAAVYAISHPNQLITNLAKECDIKILSINEQTIKKEISKEPYFIYTIIEANTYPWNQKEIKTLGTIATLVTNSNLPKQYTCNIMQKINSSNLKLKLIHPTLHDISLHTMVPLHPGAEEFYSKIKKKY